MCEKTNEMVKNILRLIKDNTCDEKSLADLIAEKYGDVYYFSPNFTLWDILETEKIFGHIYYENGLIFLTGKGRKYIQDEDKKI